MRVAFAGTQTNGREDNHAPKKQSQSRIHGSIQRHEQHSQHRQRSIEDPEQRQAAHSFDQDGQYDGSVTTDAMEGVVRLAI